MNTILGGLIEYENQNELDNFISNANFNDNIKIIEKALEYSCRKGIYTMEETFFIYKCISKIKDDGRKIFNLPGNNPDGNTTG